MSGDSDAPTAPAPEFTVSFHAKNRLIDSLRLIDGLQPVQALAARRPLQILRCAGGGGVY